MPVLAAVGAAIGSAVLGPAIGAAIGGTMGSVIGGAIAGAIGGAIGGGIGSVVQGGNFWDGAKAGALGGALSGGFSAAGGLDGLSDMISGGGGEVAAAAAEPSLAFNSGFAESSFDQAIGAAADPLGQAGASEFAMPSLNDTLISPELASPDLGMIARSAPTHGALASGTGMVEMGQAGSQNSFLRDILGDKAQNLSPSDVTQLGYNAVTQGQRSSGMRDFLSQQRAENTGLRDMMKTEYTAAGDRSQQLQSRVNDLFAKYGMKGR